jgi:hypothetical protein
MGRGSEVRVLAVWAMDAATEIFAEHFRNSFLARAMYEN